MKSYINKVKPYQVSSHDIWEMSESEKKKCLKLDWNEATIPPSPKVRDRIKELAAAGDFYQWYPNTYNLSLNSKIASYMKVDEREVQVFASSDTLQEYVVRCWLKTGDRVLILWPTYDNFRATSEIASAKTVYSFMKNLKFDIDKFQRDIDLNRPQMVYICNPNNPTGEQIAPNIIEYIVKANESILFLIDEAYAEFSGKTVSELVGKYENILISRTFSKAFALANFRIGYLISSKKNIEEISKIRNSKNITTFSQEAAIAAMDDLEYMKNNVKNVKNAREFILKQIELKPDLHFLKIYPSETNFFLLKLKDADTKRNFMGFMRSKNIYIRDLQQDVLSECFVRITVGTMEQMQTVFEAIRGFGVLYHESGCI